MEIERMDEQFISREDKIEQAIKYLRDEVIGMTKGDPEKRLALFYNLDQIGCLISETYVWG